MRSDALAILLWFKFVFLLKGIFGLRLSAIDNSTRTSASKGKIDRYFAVEKLLMIVKMCSQINYVSK